MNRADSLKRILDLMCGSWVVRWGTCTAGRGGTCTAGRCFSSDTPFLIETSPITITVQVGGG